MNAPSIAGVPAMAQQARELARAGRAADAALLWQRILGADPAHVESLVGLGTQALARRDAAAALALFQRAATAAPTDPMLHVYAAVAL